jgi:uncharacterized protein HI_1422
MELSLTFPTTELQGAFPANAETLFKFLVINSKFADWIKNRITQYGFIENQDYIVKTTYTGRRPRKEYFVTLDMAKELCMVENNDKGKEARRYFIKCEKELQAIKFETYVSKIADLEASQILQTKRHGDQINGYLGQLAKHNAVIASLKNELAEFKTSNPRPETLRTLLEHARKERDFYKQKLQKTEKEKRDKELVTFRALQQTKEQLEHVYTAIGAVEAYVANDDRFFMEQNEILKG